MKLIAFEVRADERPAFEEVMGKKGLDVTLCPEELTLENVETCAGFDGVTTLGHTVLNRRLLEKLKALGVRAVSTRTVGCNHIDLAAARELGIAVCNTSYGPECVAELTVMHLLLCLRKYKQILWRMQVNDYSLGGLVGKQIGSLTVGVIGTGRIGRQVMQDLSGFGCKFLCYDPYPHPQAAAMGTYVSLDEIWANCDVITLHSPLTEENHHMINRETIAKMKPGVILINAARGGLMDVDAVTEGVEDCKIGAVALDVFEDEDGIYHSDLRTDIIKNRAMAYLRQFPNVVMTPHVGFYTEEAVKSMVVGGVLGLYELLTTGTTATRVV